MKKVNFIIRARVWVMVRVRVLICQSERTRERVKVSHVVVECRVINHHPIPFELHALV